MMEDIGERLAACFLGFENKLVKVVALRELRGLRLEGFTVGPYEEKREYEARLWVADQLEREGYVTIRSGELLDFNMLSKIHWTESLQSARQLSNLPEDFYPKLKRYLASLRERIEKGPQGVSRYERSRQLVADIVERRLRRITVMASGPPIANGMLRSLTEEERVLYENLRSTIERWRSVVLGVEERPRHD